MSSAQLIGSAHLPGFGLSFFKRSADASGKCSIEPDGQGLHVAIYEISAADKQKLDTIEGVGRGYDLHAVRVRAGNATLDAFTYRANAAWIE